MKNKEQKNKQTQKTQKTNKVRMISLKNQKLILYFYSLPYAQLAIDTSAICSQRQKQIFTPIYNGKHFYH